MTATISPFIFWIWISRHCFWAHLCNAETCSMTSSHISGRVLVGQSRLKYCFMFWSIWSALFLLPSPCLLIFFLNVVSMLKWPERNVYILFSVSSWMLFNVWFYVVVMSSRLNFGFIYFSDMSILLACIPVSHVCALCLWLSEENISFLVLDLLVIDNIMGPRNWSWVLWKRNIFSQTLSHLLID